MIAAAATVVLWFARPTAGQAASAAEQALSDNAVGTSWLPFDTRCKNAGTGWNCKTFLIDYSGHPMTFHCWSFHFSPSGKFSNEQDYTRLKSCPEHLPRRNSA